MRESSVVPISPGRAFPKGAPIGEETPGRSAGTAEAFRRLSDAILGKTDMRAALAALNRGVLADMGLECRGVTFSDPVLCAMLDLTLPTMEEAAVLREWRHARPRPPVFRFDAPGRVLVPIRLAGRIAGVLRIAGARDLEPDETRFLQSLADGIGDMAYKAKLSRVGERRARELAVARERERIAHDLHDTVGQLFYGLCLKSQHCLALDPDDPEDRRALTAELEAIRRLASEGIGDVRAAVYSLAFLHVRAGGLVRSLHLLTEEFLRSTGLAVRLVVPPGRARRLPEEVESALYRVAHEALVNVERHARASGVTMSLQVSDGVAELVVRDDGVGLDQRVAPDWRSAAHFGVRMMARTIREMGGTFRVEPSDPRGLTIRARVPLARRAPVVEKWSR